MENLRFGSVCSGIEAASVAWEPLGWRAAWFAEIEPFPCAVLAHHYPDVPNLGDMSKLPDRVLSGEIEAPDIFCGGTPCQAFSVAGLRRSLDDARGNLSLVFCEIADAIDTVRSSRGEQPAVIFWENVPGVLSTSDNAFGCFLAGLAGEDDPLVAPGGKWTNAGYVLGPQRAVAWRVTDAQYFGVAQRRRRVFVVASAREGFDPAAVLFEFDGVRRDTPPSREAGEGTAGGFARSVALRGREGGGTAELGDDVQNCLRASGGGGDKAHVLAFGGNNQSGPIDIATARNACASASASGRMDFESETFLVHGTQDPCVSTDTAFALGRNSGRENAIAFSCKDHGGDAGPLSPTLRSMGHDGSHANSGWQVAVAWSLMPQNSGKDFKARQVEVLQPLMAAGPTHGNQGGDIIQSAMQVRRLTPRECERLQGFPDDYTLIPWKAHQAWAKKKGTHADGKSFEEWLIETTGRGLRQPTTQECPDGPRHKALGNSWAVPNVRWIGRRIDAALKGAA